MEIRTVGVVGLGKAVNNPTLWSRISTNHEGMALAGALSVDTGTLRTVRLSLPLCGSVKEVIKGIKINLGQGMPRER